MDTAAKSPRQLAQESLAANRREQILDGAIALFARHGYPDTDTQRLADALGIGKGTLYRYFPSKEDLFLAAVDRIMRQLHEAIMARIQGSADPLDEIAEAIRTYLTFFNEHPDYVELLVQERAQFKDRKKPTYFQHREANIERWREMYRQLIRTGRFRDMPVERITDVISDLVYGTMFTNYFTEHRKPPDEQARDILDVFFNGVLSDSERRQRPPAG